MPLEESALSPGGYTFLRSFALALQAYCFLLFAREAYTGLKEGFYSHAFPFSAPRRSSWSDTPYLPFLRAPFVSYAGPALKMLQKEVVERSFS